MNRAPLYLIPWQRNFLPDLMDILLQRHGNDLQSVLCVFPHDRAQQYALHYLRTAPHISRPMILPSIHTGGSFIDMLARRIGISPAWQAGLLDQVGLLLQAVNNAEIISSEAQQNYFHSGTDLFFPWGVKLAALFEECFAHGCTPDDLHLIEHEVPPFAASLLEHLGSIFSHYCKLLDDKNWTTPAHVGHKVANHCQQNTTFPLHDEYTHVYFAGFFSLSGTEEILFKHLWQTHEAHFFVHADPDILTSTKGHWSCRPLLQWAQRWHTTIVPAIPETLDTAGHHRPTITFHEGFDLHSQLDMLQQQLTKISPSAQKNFAQQTEAIDDASNLASLQEQAPSLNAPSTYSAPVAIVLPESGLLMPVLHHTPNIDCNISMGYPLARSPLFQLVQTIFTLQEKRRGSTYYWRDLINLVRHPYLKMLHPTEEESAPDSFALRQEFRRMEKAVRSSGATFIDPFSIMRLTYGAMQQEELPPTQYIALLEKILQTTLSNFATPTTLHALGTAFEQLSSLLLSYGHEVWSKFPIDAECLHRLLQSLIPELLHSALSQENLSTATLFTLTRQLLQQERVPFTAAPLVGMQIIGMLETRLLSFEHIFLIDATEENLPGSSTANPLLPPSIRIALGLPAENTRNQVSAYHFSRLLAGAKHVHLFWQESNEQTDKGKKQRSRFIEELLWQQEQQQGYLVDAPQNTIPYYSLDTQLTAAKASQQALFVTPGMHTLTNNVLSHGISASLLDAYLMCPSRFFYERIAKLIEPQEVTESDDPLAVGTLLHQTLHEFFTPYIGKEFTVTTTNKEQLQQELQATFHACLQASSLYTSLPADALAMLKASAHIRLDWLIDHTPTCIPFALEQTITSSVHIDGHTFPCKGILDRLDIRESNRIVVVDYKTGTLSNTKDVWEDVHFWQLLQKWHPHMRAADSLAPLEAITNAFTRIQLLFYLYLLHTGDQSIVQQAQKYASTPVILDNALFVSLGNKGEENPLLASSIDELYKKNIITQQIPQIITFIIQHIRNSTYYYPRPGSHCLWCSSKKLCIVSSQTV